MNKKILIFVALLAGSGLILTEGFTEAGLFDRMRARREARKAHVHHTAPAAESYGSSGSSGTYRSYSIAPVYAYYTSESYGSSGSSGTFSSPEKTPTVYQSSGMGSSGSYGYRVESYRPVMQRAVYSTPRPRVIQGYRQGSCPTCN